MGLINAIRQVFTCLMIFYTVAVLSEGFSLPFHVIKGFQSAASLVLFGTGDGCYDMCAADFVTENKSVHYCYI